MAIAGMYDLFNEKWCKQTIWLISDTHFGDAELRAGIPDRISDDDLVKLINSKVGRKDTIIHLGDVGDVEYIKKLRGYKVLICGNHDAGATNYQREVKRVIMSYSLNKEEAFAQVRKNYPGYRIDLLAEGFGGWVFEIDNCLFDEIYTGPLMVGEKLLLSHEPVDIPWAFNIHGHRHTKQPNDDHHLNVCLDVTNYQPINLNQLMKNGLTSKVETIHRNTIDRATIRAKKKKKKEK